MTVLVLSQVVVPTFIPTPGGTQGPPGPAGSGSTIGVKDEGSLVSAVVERVNFTGAGVSISGSGADVAINVPGSSGGGDIGLLKDAATQSIPSGTNLVQTSGNESTGTGVAQYASDPAITSAYLASHPKSGFVDSAGRGFRILREELFMPQKFYQATDANFGFAVNRALDYLGEAIAVNDDTGVYRGTRELFTPAGNYDLGANTTDLFVTIRLRGESTGGEGGRGTRFRYSGATGVRTQRMNTTGASGLRANGHAGDASIIEGIDFEGNYSGTEAEFHGLHAKARVIVNNCSFRRFAGDGIHHVALLGGGGASEGNANCSYYNQVTTQFNRNGYFADGDNTNASWTLGLNASYNRQWGLWDSSFLANQHLGFHLDSNAMTVNDGTGLGSLSLCTYSGFIYYCIVGQETWCSTHAPTGSATSNQGWGYAAAGGVGAYNSRAWVTGMTWRAGGPLDCDNPNAPHFISGYCEGSPCPAMLEYPAFLCGGGFYNAVKHWGTNDDYGGIAGAAAVGAGGGMAFSGRGLFVGDVKAGGCVAIGGGGQGGGLGSMYGYTVPVLAYDNSGALGVVMWCKGGGSGTDFLMFNSSGQPVVQNPHGTQDWEALGDLLVPSGKGVKVNGQRVVTNRQSAIGDPSGGTVIDVEARAALTSFLTAARNHGLIA